MIIKTQFGSVFDHPACVSTSFSLLFSSDAHIPSSVPLFPKRVGLNTLLFPDRFYIWWKHSKNIHLIYCRPSRPMMKSARSDVGTRFLSNFNTSYFANIAAARWYSGTNCSQAPTFRIAMNKIFTVSALMTYMPLLVQKTIFVLAFLLAIARRTSKPSAFLGRRP